MENVLVQVILFSKSVHKVALPHLWHYNEKEGKKKNYGYDIMAQKQAKHSQNRKEKKKKM